MILTQQDSEENLLRFVAHAVEFLGPFKTYGIFAGDHWQDVRPAGPEDGPAGLPARIPAGAPGPGGCPVRPREGSSRSKTCCGRGPTRAADSMARVRSGLRAVGIRLRHWRHPTGPPMAGEA